MELPPVTNSFTWVCSVSLRCHFHKRGLYFRDDTENNMHSAVIILIFPPSWKPMLLQPPSFLRLKEYKSFHNSAFILLLLFISSPFSSSFSSVSLSCKLSSNLFYLFYFPPYYNFSRSYYHPILRVSTSKGKNLIQPGPGWTYG